jgi:hypothetical protein
MSGGLGLAAALCCLDRRLVISVLLFIALAFVIAIGLDPVVGILCRLAVPRWLGVVIVLLVVLSVVGLFLALAIPPLVNESNRLINLAPALRVVVTGQELAACPPQPSIPRRTRLRQSTREYVDKLFPAAEVEPLLGPPYRTLLEALAFVARSPAGTMVAGSVAARERSASVVSIRLRDSGAAVRVSLAWPSVGAGPVARAPVGDLNSLRREGAFDSLRSFSRQPTAPPVELCTTR